MNFGKQFPWICPFYEHSLQLSS